MTIGATLLRITAIRCLCVAALIGLSMAPLTAQTQTIHDRQSGTFDGSGAMEEVDRDVRQASYSANISDVDSVEHAVHLDNESTQQDDISRVGFFDDLRSSSGSLCGCGRSSNCSCPTPWWVHRTSVFAQSLLIRPGNTDLVYAIEQNSVLPGDDPTGPVGRANIDETLAYRVGFSCAASDCTSLVASYTGFSGDTTDRIIAAPGDVLNSQIIHPSEITVGAASLQSSATYGLDFQLIDLAYRHRLKASNIYAVNWLAGFRYGNMEQVLSSQQEIQVATGPITNSANVEFGGFGMLFGLDGERRSSLTGLSIYGRAIGALLAGDWSARYVQTNNIINGGIIANGYEDYRVTPVSELEVGFGWQSNGGMIRASLGYMTSFWHDAVSMRNYIDAVRATNYHSIEETITFSGFTAGLEIFL